MIVVCTPTRNRGWTQAFSEACMRTQSLQPDHWIVLDNSDIPEKGWVTSAAFTVTRIEGNQTVACMRNHILDMAMALGADFIVFWDDDDYYPPQRIRTGVEGLQSNPKAEIATSSMMYVLLTQENCLMGVGPYDDSHGTAATYTIRRAYAATHRFDATKTFGEEYSFTRGWKAKMLQLPAEDVIVVMGHKWNTVSKSDMFWHPDKYLAKVVNNINGKQAWRSRWRLSQEIWDLWKTTFSVVESHLPQDFV